MQEEKEIGEVENGGFLPVPTSAVLVVKDFRKWGFLRKKAINNGGIVQGYQEKKRKRGNG
jgi:hypothetical protein